VTEYQKLTTYFGERQRSGGAFVADALLELYGRHEIAASILLRGTEGFGLKHHLRTDRSLSLSEDLPLVAVAVDTRPRIEAMLGPALALNPTGLVTLEGARLLDDTVVANTGVAGPDEATKLTVYLGRQERVYRVPAFVAVCDLLHRRGVDGATALLGVDGTAHGRRQRAAFFSRNAEVPMMIIAVGAGEQISRVLPELGALLRRPLLTLERVRVGKRDGRSLAGPGEDRPSQWQKLMVYTSEATRHQGQPVHRAIVRRLRSAGLSGGHHAARHLGLSRRPRPARRPAAATGPARARRHGRHRHPRADRPGVRDHRRADQRARAGDLRDHHLPGRGRPTGPGSAGCYGNWPALAVKACWRMALAPLT